MPNGAPEDLDTAFLEYPDHVGGGVCSAMPSEMIHIDLEIATGARTPRPEDVLTRTVSLWRDVHVDVKGTTPKGLPRVAEEDLLAIMHYPQIEVVVVAPCQ